MRARLAGTDWFAHLPLVLLGLRSTPREDSSVSASEALFGAPLVLPGEFLDSPELPSKEFLRRVQQVLKNNPVSPPHHKSATMVPSSTVPLSLLSAAYVFIREDSSKPPLSPLYRGPYKVLSRTPKYFVVQIGSKHDTVSVDRLKPVLSETPVVPQLPPRRGRPPALKPPAPVPPAPKPPALVPPSIIRKLPTSLKKDIKPSKRVRMSPEVDLRLGTRQNPRRSVRDKPRPLYSVDRC